MGVLVHVMLNIIGQIEDLVEFFHTEIQRAHYMSHRVLLFDLYIFFRYCCKKQMSDCTAACFLYIGTS